MAVGACGHSDATRLITDSAQPGRLWIGPPTGPRARSRRLPRVKEQVLTAESDSRHGKMLVIWPH